MPLKKRTVVLSKKVPLFSIVKISGRQFIVGAVCLFGWLVSMGLDYLAYISYMFSKAYINLGVKVRRRLV